MLHSVCPLIGHVFILQSSSEKLLTATLERMKEKEKIINSTKICMKLKICQNKKNYVLNCLSDFEIE